jgi:prepilin-type N-terminal cleavage/methylation domain-containing protein
MELGALREPIPFDERNEFARPVFTKVHTDNSRGFTLIELLVVIAIIGILSAVVLAALNTARQKTQFAKMQEDMHSIETQVDIARNGYLLNLTGSNCSYCAGTATNLASWAKIGFTSPPKDPWGNVYFIDENEGEVPSELCRYDMVYSQGPSSAFAGAFSSGGIGSGTVPGTIYTSGTSYGFALSFYRCTAPN